jgi:16S rRNA (cytidine1402-2'-O)-methyltransferase
MMVKEHTRPAIKSNAARKAALYVVATPIGNLGDMSFRAVEILKSVDAIACEDTRTTHTLLSHYGIKTRSFSCHAHNERDATENILKQLHEGKSIALVSDAGTPLISDPGAYLVQAVREAGFDVFPIPGASAAIAALTGSGLASGAFYFAGFLPQTVQEMDAVVQRLQATTCPCVLYEAPHRIAKTLARLAEAMPERDASIARELTKLHETWYRGTLTALAKQLRDAPVKGECVIVLAALPEEATSDALVERMLRDALTRLPTTKAAAEIAKATGRKRADLYTLALTLKSDV